MKETIIFMLSIILLSCATTENSKKELGKRILADQSLPKVEKMVNY